MPPIFLRLAQVIQRTALSRTTIYSKIRAKEFPASVNLGSRHITAWLSDEIDAWAADQVRASRTSCGVTAHSGENLTRTQGANRTKPLVSGVDVGMTAHTARPLRARPVSVSQAPSRRKEKHA